MSSTDSNVLDNPFYQEMAKNYRPDDVEASAVLEELQYLTDSEREVYELLEEQPMTTEELHRSGVPIRTARKALAELQDIGAVYKFPSLLDERTKIYHVTFDSEDHDYDTEHL